LGASVNWIPFAWRRQVKNVPGVAALQRLIVSRFLSAEPFIHFVNAGPAAGLRFEISLPKDKAIWTGTHEPAFASAIADSVHRGDVCYDVGGYRGYLGGVMAIAGASAVIVFEPLPANQRALKRLCELNPELPIQVQPIALGATNSPVTLQVMPDDSMGRLATSALSPGTQPPAFISVDVRTLDELQSRGEIPPPDLIKIDVEGAELDVLRGATATLRLSQPLVFLEAHSQVIEVECVKELESQGYSTRRIGSDPGKDDHARHLEGRPLQRHPRGQRGS
jgi:FkbM family methyltransferase